jgi:hypothetical protein
MTVGGGVVALNAVAGVWGLLTWKRDREVSRLLQQVLALSQTFVLFQCLFGLYLLAGGNRAPARLHYVYGLLPAAAIVFAYSARTDDGHKNLLVFSIAALVITGLAIRAFFTGRM